MLEFLSVLSRGFCYHPHWNSKPCILGTYTAWIFNCWTSSILDTICSQPTPCNFWKLVDADNALKSFLLLILHSSMVYLNLLHTNDAFKLMLLHSGLKLTQQLTNWNKEQSLNTSKERDCWEKYRWTAYNCRLQYNERNLLIEIYEM